MRPVGRSRSHQTTAPRTRQGPCASEIGLRHQTGEPARSCARRDLSDLREQATPACRRRPAVPRRQRVRCGPRTAAVSAREGHNLVVPREHCRDLTDIHPDRAGLLMRGAVHTAALLRCTLEPGGMNLWQAAGPMAWQTVFHFHLHLLPHYTPSISSRHGRIGNCRCRRCRHWPITSEPPRCPEATSFRASSAWFARR
ncbi:HIT domain-containing protein [Nonomuraea sp. NPDC005650]|uniref:HIT domain-containing protein n=1 Tax=Nonomuraea sp. NPDC005650 TaxID=3157045 RepID=UPI0033A33E12